MSKWMFLLFSILLTCAANLPAQVQSGYLNDFNDGTLQGWHEGGASPNQPYIISSGGPDGAADPYLRNTSSGTSGPGGKCVMFNSHSGWTGNYFMADVKVISMHARNSGSTELNLRIAFNGEGGVICSKQSTLLKVDSTWHSIQFSLDTSDMVLLTKGGHISTTLEMVTEVRILSSWEPSWTGDQIMLSMDIDNIRADATLLNKNRHWDGFRLAEYVVYPNPTNGLLKISCIDSERWIEEIAIMNIEGLEIWKGRDFFSGEVEIILPAISGGAYWMLVDGKVMIPFVHQQ